MSVPGADPNYPPYGRGDGRSPSAVGGAAFETPVQSPIAVRTQAEPRFSRRDIRAERQELGFTIPSVAGYDQTPTAAISVASYPETSPVPAGDPAGNYGVTAPDDANTAAPMVRT